MKKKKEEVNDNIKVDDFKESVKSTKNAFALYTPEEKEYYKQLIKRLSQARDLQRIPLREYDDKTYIQQYNANRDADLSYNPDLDSEEGLGKGVTTGLTREKDTTILSTLLSMNYKPNVTAFEKDNTIIAGLGNELEDLVVKSREIEVYDEKKQSIYRELIAQGVVYVEEVYTERKIPANVDINWSPKQKISEYKGDNYPIYDIEEKCEVKLHLGKYVLTSSMTEQEIQNNDLVATYEELDRGVAQTIYGDWDRWDLVPECVENETPFNENQERNSGADFLWNTFKVGKGKVGVTKVYERFSNKYMILLNGVMVLPVNFPLTKRSPSGLIPIAKGLGEVIPNFRDGKGIPSKTRVDQKLYDTVLRAMVGKAWQSFNPALGTKSGNNLSKDIIKANTLTSGIKKDDIFTILPEQLLSISNGDVSMFNILKEIINEKSVTDSFSGQNTEANTATEVINQKKQTMIKLISLIDGVKNLERRLVFLRIYNILVNYTKSQDVVFNEEVKEIIDGVEMITKKTKSSKKYKKFNTKTSFQDGKKGQKITEFVGDDFEYPSVRDQIRYEDDMTKKYGMETRISYINAEWLRKLQAIFNIDIIVSPDTDDNMQLLMFIDNLTRVANMFGVEVFKKDYVLQRISVKMNEDFDKLFQVEDNTLMNMLNQAMGNNQNPTDVKNPAESITNSTKPSALNTMKTM